MSNSSLVDYTRISPNRTSPRRNKITHIVIHHMAGNLSVETCGNVFADSNREASANYGIGSDGRIGMYVEEKDRSWATSNAEIDNKAVTIEVANSSSGGNWLVSAKALQTVIELCTDICKRNGISKLSYTGDKSGNLHMHKWYASTACPGPYLASKFPYIAQEVNKNLSGSSSKSSLYRVRKSWSDSKSQIGAYANLDNAKKVVDKNPSYKAFNENGIQVYPVDLTSSYKVKVKITDLYIRKGPGTSYTAAGFIEPGVYTIVETRGNWGRLKSGAGWICLDYVTRV